MLGSCTAVFPQSAGIGSTPHGTGPATDRAVVSSGTEGATTDRRRSASSATTRISSYSGQAAWVLTGNPGGGAAEKPGRACCPLHPEELDRANPLFRERRSANRQQRHRPRNSRRSIGPQQLSILCHR